MSTTGHTFPSRANYVIIKNRLILIEKGHAMLKRKRDALEVKLRECTHELDALRESSILAIRDACFCIARLNYLGVDLRHTPMLSYPNADVYLKLAFIKLIGVTVPKFNMHVRPSNCFDYTGLSSGGLAVAEAREKFQLALEELTHYASLEYTVKVLHEGIRVNNMRVNGMEFVLIPRFQSTINYILEEIDEFDRQDFYRLKRSRAKRMENMKADIIQLREKRDNPEEYARKKKEQELKRYSLPHWRSILTPKINVDFKLAYMIKIRRRMFRRKEAFDIENSDLELAHEEEIEEEEFNGYEIGELEESDMPDVEINSISSPSSGGRSLADIPPRVLEDDEELENDKDEKLINVSGYSDVSEVSEDQTY